MIHLEIDEQKLIETMRRAAETCRLTGINSHGIESLARQTYIYLAPQREEFKPGDEIVWRHAYDRKEYPYPKGVVLYWSESQTRVKIKYINTLFDNPIGADVEVWVYPREIVHAKDYVDPDSGAPDGSLEDGGDRE